MDLASPVGSVLGFLFYKCGKYDLRIYLTLTLTNCSGERPLSKLIMAE